MEKANIKIKQTVFKPSFLPSFDEWTPPEYERPEQFSSPFFSLLKMMYGVVKQI
jgi:hypothetical protein